MRRIWGHATNIYIFTSNHRDGTRKLVRLWGEEMAGVDQWGDPTVPHGHGLRKTINNLIVSRMELSSMRRPEVARMVTFGMLWNHLPGYLSVFFRREMDMAWYGCFSSHWSTRFPPLILLKERTMPHHSDHSWQGSTADEQSLEVWGPPNLPMKSGKSYPPPWRPWFTLCWFLPLEIP
jgi:hypothetical protein